MLLVDKLFILRHVPLLADLEIGELTKVAAAMRLRDHPPGQLVAAAGRALPGLLVVASGSVRRADGALLPSWFGLEALLGDVILPQDLLAGAAGARCLLLARNHLSTLVLEGTRVASHLLAHLEESCRATGALRS